MYDTISIQKQLEYVVDNRLGGYTSWNKREREKKDEKEYEGRIELMLL